jgi:DNA-binding NarL/FixJ family response regulator
MGDDDRSEPRPTPHRAAGEPGPVAPVESRRAPVALTRRERQVVGLIAKGLTNRQIAERLTLSVRTIERHIANIYDRLGCTGKAGRAIATAYAIRHGLTPFANE